MLLKSLSKTALSCLLVLTAGYSSAASITNSTGIASPGTTITFSEVALTSGTVITNQYAAYGATFSPYAVFRAQDGYYPTDYIGNFNGAGTANPFVISFGHLVNAAAFDFITNDGTTTFEALNGATVVGTFSATTGIVIGTYYGFENIAFDSIRITIPVNGAMELDNLQIAAVPEADTYAMMLAGLGLLGVVARRRNAAKKV
jgi:hypothetical protein